MKVTSFFKVNQPRPRTFALLLFWGFLITGVLIRFELVDIPLSDFEWFLGPLMILSAIGMMVPTLVFGHIKPLSQEANEHMLGFVEMLIGLAMLSSWLGGAGLYRIGIEYDSFVHFFSTMLMTIMAVAILLEVDPKYKRNVALLVVLAVGFALAGGVINEVLEFGGDRVFGTEMFGDFGQANLALYDTATDFMANAFGALVGFVIAWENRERIHKYVRK